MAAFGPLLVLLGMRIVQDILNLCLLLAGHPVLLLGDGLGWLPLMW